MLQGEKVVIGDNSSQSTKLILNLTNSEGALFTGTAEIRGRKRGWKHHMYFSVEMLLTARRKMVGFRNWGRG